jgi:hypothetical protein
MLPGRSLPQAETADVPVAARHLDRLRRDPLAHPDQQRPVADDQDVAALDGGRHGIGAVVPDIEICLRGVLARRRQVGLHLFAGHKYDGV